MMGMIEVFNKKNEWYIKTVYHFIKKKKDE